MTANLKQCRICHVFQPLDAFPPGKSAKGRRQQLQVRGTCQTCTQALRRAEKTCRKKMMRKAA